MDTIKEKAHEILDISQKIYEMQENDNPTAIFGDKTFSIGIEENRETITVEQNYEEKDKSYYFETPEIIGAIIKRKNGNYCVKACVKYTNAINRNLWFAKYVKKLPDDIKKLCLLQRMQIIHPSAFKNITIRNSKNCFWGDMTKISNMDLLREDDILPTSISMFAEIMRKNPSYTLQREAKDKIFVTCRG